jgi:hypothetical protein
MKNGHILQFKLIYQPIILQVILLMSSILMNGDDEVYVSNNDADAGTSIS